MTEIQTMGSASESEREPLDVPELVLQFLQKDYELKITYLSNHFSRMWTRFNFFIVLETALSGGFFALFKSADWSSNGTTVAAWVGVASSACWYVFGAEDRYLVEVYKSHVRDAGIKIAEKLRLEQYLGYEYVHVGDTDTEIKRKWYDYFCEWRLNAFSTTKLAAWFPLLLLLCWIGILVWLKVR